MFNIFKKKIENNKEDGFSLNDLQKLTIESHNKYVNDKTTYLINVLKYCIKKSAQDGYYQFSTMTNYEDEFKDFYLTASPLEWDNFVITLRNTFSEIKITVSQNHPYWIDFDWFGNDSD